jgi:tetratricopeptide (TPR) repeat protein
MADTEKPKSDPAAKSSDPGRAAGQAPPGIPPQRRRLGDFEILREIGRGGMGIVYEAQQLSLHRPVALKVLPPGLGLSDSGVERFEREALAAARLHHTNIVPVYAVGQEAGCHYYAMELIEGHPLNRILEDLRGGHSNELLSETLTAGLASGERAAVSGGRSGPASQTETSAGGREWFDTVARLVAEVADGLGYAHSQGVIHRDIKPGNLLLSRQGRLCVTDFGLARVTQEPGMTVSGSFLGTPAYMSPEQIAAGRMKLDHRTDIYSLGAVLYEMLTLARPFPGESREEVVARIMTKEAAPPRRLNHRIPVDLETICLKALEKDPDRRYQTGAAMAGDLQRYLQRGLITARRAGALRRTGKFLRRHPVAAVTVIAAGLIVAVGAVAWRAMGLRAEEEARRALSDARFVVSQGSYRDALPKLNAALATDPDLVEAHLLRARVLIALAHFNEAAAEGEALLRKNPDDWAGHLILAASARGGGGAQRTRFGVSIEEHVKAVEALAPETAEAYYLRSLVADRATDALPLLNRALELDPGHAEALLARIQRFDEVHDYKAALADCDRLIAVRPRSARGRQLRAMVLYNTQKDVAGSLSEATKAIELDPLDPRGYYLRSQDHQFKGDYEAAKADLSRAIELDPQNVMFIARRAQVHANFGHRPEAIADANRAIDLDPGRPGPYGTLFWTYFNQGENDKARQVADRLSAVVGKWTDPKAQAEVHGNMMWQWLRLGDPDRALAEAEMAVKLDPENWRGYLQRARMKRYLKDEPGALSDCGRASAIELHEPGEFSDRAELWIDVCDRADLAVADKSKAIELAPWWADPYIARGSLYADLGEFEKSIADFNKALGIAPAYSDLYRNRSSAYAEMGNLEEALKDADKAIELAPRAAGLYIQRSDILRRLGRLDDAIAACDKAIELAPTSWWGYLNRAVNQAWGGRCDRALADYRKGLEVEPAAWQNTMKAFIQVHELYYNCPSSSSADEALASARKAVALENRDAGAQLVLGISLYRTGHFQESLDALNKAASRRLRPNAEDQLHLAMTLWKLGRREQARSCFKQGVAAMRPRESPAVLRVKEEAAQVLGLAPATARPVASRPSAGSSSR